MAAESTSPVHRCLPPRPLQLGPPAHVAALMRHLASVHGATSALGYALEVLELRGSSQAAFLLETWLTWLLSPVLGASAMGNGLATAARTLCLLQPCVGLLPIDIRKRAAELLHLLCGCSRLRHSLPRSLLQRMHGVLRTVKSLCASPCSCAVSPPQPPPTTTLKTHPTWIRPAAGSLISAAMSASRHARSGHTGAQTGPTPAPATAPVTLLAPPEDHPESTTDSHVSSLYWPGSASSYSEYLIQEKVSRGVSACMGQAQQQQQQQQCQQKGLTDPAWLEYELRLHSQLLQLQHSDLPASAPGHDAESHCEAGRSLACAPDASAVQDRSPKRQRRQSTVAEGRARGADGLAAAGADEGAAAADAALSSLMPPGCEARPHAQRTVCGLQEWDRCRAALAALSASLDPSATDWQQLQHDLETAASAAASVASSAAAAAATAATADVCMLPPSQLQQQLHAMHTSSRGNETAPAESAYAYGVAPAWAMHSVAAVADGAPAASPGSDEGRHADEASGTAAGAVRAAAVPWAIPGMCGDTILLLIKHLLSPTAQGPSGPAAAAAAGGGLSGAASRLLMQASLLPALVAQSAVLPRPLLEATLAVGAVQPRAVMEAVLVPLVRDPHLSPGQAQLVVRAAKEVLQTAPHCAALLAAACAGAGQWGDPHVTCVQGILDVKPPLDMCSQGVREQLLRALDTAVDHMAASVPFARMLLTLLSHPGAGFGAQGPQTGGGQAARQVLGVAQRINCFLGKTLVSKASALAERL